MAALLSHSGQTHKFVQFKERKMVHRYFRNGKKVKRTKTQGKCIPTGHILVNLVWGDGISGHSEWHMMTIEEYKSQCTHQCSYHNGSGTSGTDPTISQSDE